MSFSIGNRTAVINILNSLKDPEKNDAVYLNYAPDIVRGKNGVNISRTLLRNLTALKFNLNDFEIDNAIDDLKSDGVLIDIQGTENKGFLKYNNAVKFSSQDLDDLRKLFEDKTDIK